MQNPILEQKLKELPQTPGVYQFKNIKGKIIYVGKAKVLKNRVSSYFLKNLRLGSKTHALVSRIVDLEYIKTESELEALLLEAQLIKSYKPKYNVALKDDKSYLYIVFRNEQLEVAGKEYSIPKVLTARKTDLLPKDKVFGPYPHAQSAKYILRLIRKVFPFRDCSHAKFNKYAKLGTPCLYGHLELCSAPCIQRISTEDYKKQIKTLKKFLSGDSSKMMSTFRKKMIAASKTQKYEEAAYYRDTLRKMEYVRTNPSSADKYIENPNFVEDLANDAIQEIQDALPHLSKLPKRIECYDISNISGKEAVGSMVVATKGQIDKSQYRRFRIKFKATPDDFEMMSEVLTRRFNNDWPMPDLVVLDGGKGQVSAVLDIAQKMNIQIPIVGLAKKKETIVYKETSEFIELNLPKNNEGLKLLIKLRDEAHRFAQTYHHKLRSKLILVV